MLVARSATESRLYMDLHPCACGETGFDWSQHERRQHGETTSDVYEGRCAGCDLERRFEFVVDPEPLPEPTALGGRSPSTIIDPAEFLTVAQQLADAVPADPRDVPEEYFDDAYAAIELAAAATDEVLKFIPPGADAVPPDAFFSADGLAAYRSNQHRFTRDWLTATRRSYRR